MEASTDANATQLPSSPSSVHRRTFHGFDDQQLTATYNVQEQMVRIMVDQQQRAVCHMEADGEGEAEDIHVVCNSNNTIDLAAGVQHSEVHGISSESESDIESESESEGEGEIQEVDMGDMSPRQCDTDVGSDSQDDVANANSSLPPINMTEVVVNTSGIPHQLDMLVDEAYDDVNDEERGIFVDFDEDSDVDNDEERLIQEQDSEIEEDNGFIFDDTTTLAYPGTNEIISMHLCTPNPQSFQSLDNLLSSHNAPGRGLYNVEKVLEHEERRVSELEEKIQFIQAELEETRARRHRADEVARKARAIFSQNRIRAGISNQLWAEYEAFCESLEPKFGNRGGWSITCYENHNGSYLKWDPNLILFMESAEMQLGICNFRCEATTIKSNRSTEYVVEFWPLASPEPEIGRAGAAKTWKQQYPKLYQLATEAANSSTDGNTVAKELLQSLPHPKLPFSGGWLFEYVREHSRAQHPTVSRRWSYRSAHRLPVDEQQDQVDALAESEPDTAGSQDEDEDAEYVESESAESQDVKMEEDGSELAESQDVTMEYDE